MIIFNDKIFDGSNLYKDGYIWRRRPQTYDNKNDKYIIEITGNILYLTNDHFLNNNYNFNYTHDSIYDDGLNMTCICGHDYCGELYIINHEPTNIKFAVGSRCIKKFKCKGYDELNRNDMCLSCLNVLWFKNTSTHTKNGYKGYPYCNECHKIKFLSNFFNKLI